MAKGAGSRGKSGQGGARRVSKGGPVKRSSAKKPPAKKSPLRPVPDALEQPVEVTGTFVLGAVPGATVGGWIDAWKQRMTRCALELRPIAVSTQRASFAEEELDAAIVRLPLGGEDLHVISLYDEVVVVVVSADSHLTAADDLELADLVGEVVIVPQDDVLALTVPGGAAASFAPPETTEQAIATVAAGVGLVIVPMSLARLYQRKDVAYRPLRDVPRSTVALAWPIEATTPAVEAFIGIVRGRTVNSTRG